MSADEFPTTTPAVGEEQERGGDQEPSPNDPMEFVVVARFSSRLEAETVGHALDPREIPFLVQSSDIGMFGPGMGSFTPEGAALLVPSDREEEVRQLLECAVFPREEDLPEELRPEPDEDSD